ncbi:MAG: hypothetical protein AAF611_01515 [Bacteroidota bacterium]
MGQGGYLTLVNSTDTIWRKTYQHSYQMNVWNFPNVVDAQTCVSIYVEWNQHFFNNASDDAGEVVYALGDTNDSFEIQANATSGFDLKVYFLHLKTHSNQNEALFSLGWNPKGTVSFILSGTKGQYSSSNLNGSSWMRDNLALLGTKELSELCIPGTHHAGMNVKTSNTFGATACNVLTQTRNVREQLQLGVRYLDISPVLKEGYYFAGNYRKIEAIYAWQGATGQSIEHIIEDINAFTLVRQELVILNLSNSLNTDVEDSMYRSFNTTEWHRLLKLLSKINHRFHALRSMDLSVKTLNEYISQKAAVLIIINDTIDLGSYWGKGFFKPSSFHIKYQYTNTNNIAKMAADQFEKMKTQSLAYFLLPWTLKQNTFQASMCFFGTASSIKELANEANQQLPSLVYPKISNTTFPNIILVDNLLTSELAAFVMAINWKIHQIIKTNQESPISEKIILPNKL